MMKCKNQKEYKMMKCKNQKDYTNKQYKMMKCKNQKDYTKTIDNFELTVAYEDGVTIFTGLSKLNEKVYFRQFDDLAVKAEHWHFDSSLQLYNIFTKSMQIAKHLSIDDLGNITFSIFLSCFEDMPPVKYTIELQQREQGQLQRHERMLGRVNKRLIALQDKNLTNHFEKLILAPNRNCSYYSYYNCSQDKTIVRNGNANGSWVQMEFQPLIPAQGKYYADFQINNLPTYIGIFDNALKNSVTTYNHQNAITLNIHSQGLNIYLKGSNLSCKLWVFEQNEIIRIEVDRDQNMIYLKSEDRQVGEIPLSKLLRSKQLCFKLETINKNEQIKIL